MGPITTQTCSIALTRPVKRLAHRGHELARGEFHYLGLFSASGSGKTTVLRWLLAKLAWPESIEHYIDVIRAAEDPDRRSEACRFDLEALLAFAEAHGLVIADTKAQAVDCPGRRFRNRGDGVSGAAACYYLDFLADRLGQPRLGALALAPLRGIPTELTWAFPLLITASLVDTARMLATKILRAMDLDSVEEMQGSARYEFLERWLCRMPVCIFLDEAGALSTDSLLFITQLCEATRTALCLVGTQQLAGRLLRDPRLRPIATRLEVKVDLGRLTASDLQTAFPQYSSEIILAVWAGSGKNWRLAVHIIQRLEETRQERPGLRITKRAVAAAARDVFAARAIQFEGTDDLEEAERLTAAAVSATPPVRQAVSVGRTRAASG